MKKLFAILMAMLVLLSALAGCGAGETSEKTSETPAAAGTVAAANPETISGDITMWTGAWNEGLMEELMVGFNEIYPDIHVTFEYLAWDGMEDKMLTAMMAGSGADVVDMAIAWNVPYASAGCLVSLDDYIAQNGIDLNDFYPGALETAMSNGHCYGLPYRTENTALFINEKIFIECGIVDEAGNAKAPKTWDELISTSQTIYEKTNGQVYGFGMVGSNAGNLMSQLYSLFFSNNVSILNEDMTAAAFNTEAGVEAFKTWCSMYTDYEGVVPASTLENDNTSCRTLFAAEKVAMFASAAYDIDAILAENPDIQMGYALMPGMTEATYPGESLLGGWNIGISKNSKNPDAAFALIEYLTSTDVSVDFSNTFSARISAAQNEKYADESQTVFKEALNYGKALPGSAHQNEITEILYNEAQAVLTGSKDAATALADAEAEVNNILS